MPRRKKSKLEHEKLLTETWAMLRKSPLLDRLFVPADEYKWWRSNGKSKKNKT